MTNAVRWARVGELVSDAEVVAPTAAGMAVLRRYGFHSAAVTHRNHEKVVPVPAPIVTIPRLSCGAGRGIAALGVVPDLKPLPDGIDTAVRLLFHTLESAAVFAAIWQSEWGTTWAGDTALEAVLALRLPLEPPEQVRELAMAAQRLRTLYAVIPLMEEIQRDPDWLASQNHRSIVPLSSIATWQWTSSPMAHSAGVCHVHWPAGMKPPTHGEGSHTEAAYEGCNAVSGGITVEARGKGSFCVPTIVEAQYLQWVLESQRHLWENLPDSSDWLSRLMAPPTCEACRHILEDRDHQEEHLAAFRQRRDATEQFVDDMTSWLMGTGEAA